MILRLFLHRFRMIMNAFFLRLTEQLRMEVFALMLPGLFLLGLEPIPLHPTVVANRLHTPRNFYVRLACADDKSVILNLMHHFRHYKLITVINHGEMIGRIPVDFCKINRQDDRCVALLIGHHIAAIDIVRLRALCAEMIEIMRFRVKRVIDLEALRAARTGATDGIDPVAG